VGFPKILLAIFFKCRGIFLRSCNIIKFKRLWEI